MKHFVIHTFFLIIYIAASTALAQVQYSIGGSGGTTGGNPKMVDTELFSHDKVREEKLLEAVKLLQSNIAESCFSKDYKRAMLTELKVIVNMDMILYFPETALLGVNRYKGDYSDNYTMYGQPQFPKVGAFTIKAKSQPIYFTKDSNDYDVEELAMTLAQELNDHVLQWNDESLLNLIGAILVKRQSCSSNAVAVLRVLSQFPEKKPNYELDKSMIYKLLEQKTEKGFKRFGKLGFKSYKKTDYGFNFTPEVYYVEGLDGRSVPKKIHNPKAMNVIVNPFFSFDFNGIAKKGITNVETSVAGIVRDEETKKTIGEFLVFSEAENTYKILMDDLCNSTEHHANDALRLRREDRHTFIKAPVCALEDKGKKAITIKLSPPQQKTSCLYDYNYDFFNQVKSLEDVSLDLFCIPRDLDFSRSIFQDLVGSKTPEEFIKLNLEKADTDFNMRSIDGSDPLSQMFIKKNILGGQVTGISSHLAIIRDDSGAVHSLYFGYNWLDINSFIAFRKMTRYTYEPFVPPGAAEVIYQCFFKGIHAGTCLRSE